METFPDLNQELFQSFYLELIRQEKSKKQARAIVRHASYYLTIFALYSREEKQASTENYEQIILLARRICNILGDSYRYHWCQAFIEESPLEIVTALDIAKARVALSLTIATRSYIIDYLPAQGIEWLNVGLSGSRVIGDQIWESRLLNDIGLLYKYYARFQIAIEYYRSSLRAEKSQDNKLSLAATLNNMGVVYNSLNQNHRALEYYNNAKKLAEGAHDLSLTADILNNICLAYFNEENYEKAHDFCLQAQALHRKIANNAGLATALNNLGLIHSAQNNLEAALTAYNESLAIRKNAGNLQEIATTLSNISSIYWSMDRVEEAAEYLQMALQIFKDLGAIHFEVAIKHNYAILLHDTAQLEKAINTLEETSLLAKDHNLSYDATNEEISLLETTLSDWYLELALQKAVDIFGDLANQWIAFLETEDWENAKTYLLSHKGLLSPEIDALVETLVTTCNRSLHYIETVILHYAVVSNIRKYGIDKAFNIASGKYTEGEAKARLVIEFIAQDDEVIAQEILKNYPLLTSTEAIPIIEQLIHELQSDDDPQNQEMLDKVKSRSKTIELYKAANKTGHEILSTTTTSNMQENASSSD